MIPPYEKKRLETLRRYSILDTLAEQVYDDITFLASQIFHAPIALITFVDVERQWFKSRIGIEATQTPRSESFCAHAILDPDSVMVVNDTTQDGRFSDHPMVTGQAGVRFYAGAPLVAPSGDALGTVCVMDTEPREFTETERQALQALSRQVVVHLEMRRLMSDLDTLSTTDGLTGLRNRRAFDEKLADELQRGRRSKSPFSVLLIDVDLFKSFNEEFGHLAGDDSLSDLARVLQYMVRNYDLLARYSGEEFGVILPYTDKDAAKTLAERLLKAVRQAKWRHRPLTISIGVSTSRAGLSAKDLLDEADKALDQAKEEGRNRIVIFDESTINIEQHSAAS